MSRPRTVPSVVELPTHRSAGRPVPCLVMGDSCVLTIAIKEGGFTAVTMQEANGPLCVANILDHDEVEALIGLLQNSIVDAKRIDAGLPPIARREEGTVQ